MTINKILKFIYPKVCYVCEQIIDGNGLCSECFLKLEFNTYSCENCGFILDPEHQSNVCLSCFKNKYYFDSFNYSFIYNDVIFKLLKDFKYYDNTNLANFFSNFIKINFTNLIKHKKIDVIVPVPIHFLKLIKRKFNHMSLVGKQLSPIDKSIEFNPFILHKFKRTKDQMKLDGLERASNIKNSFIVKKKYFDAIKGKSVLLLDDVVTTGATISECSKVLKNFGAKEVHILAIARVNGIIKQYK